MYRIMIVDDEPVIRKGLINFIPWNNLNCEIVSLAADGADAAAKLEDDKPDIVLTDIKMPEMDGIELSRLIYNKYPSMKVIILTAYSDFNFAQSAIRYGVLDFVLKPTSTDKLIEAVNKAKSIIEDERSRSTKISALENELSKNRQDLEEGFLLKVLGGAITDPEVITDKADTLEIKLDNFYGVVIRALPSSSSHRKDNKRLISALKSFVPIFIKDYTYYSVTVRSEVLCLFIRPSKYNLENIQSIADICNDLIHAINSLVDADILIGISSLKENIINIADAYEEGLAALSGRFYIDKNIFIYTGHKTIDDADILYSVNTSFDSILKHLQSGEYEKASSDLKNIYAIYKSAKIPVEDTKYVSMLLHSYILGMLPGHNLDSSSRISRGSTIWQSRSVEEIYNILVSMINLAASEISKNEANSHSIIDAINKHIKEHYSEGITLKSIAKFVHLNSSYLSRLYKKETGETLTEKITRTRIEKAKDLLINTDLKIYEVSARVGIENTNYFSMLFKKYTSMYPRHYRIFHGATND